MSYKKAIGSALLSLALAASTLPGAGAALTIHKGGEGTNPNFTVESPATGGGQYLLLVVRKGTDLNNLNVDSILYIDQQQATANTVKFSNVVDSTKGFLLKNNQDADVYVIGQNGTEGTDQILFSSAPTDGSFLKSDESVTPAPEQVKQELPITFEGEKTAPTITIEKTEGTNKTVTLTKTATPQVFEVEGAQTGDSIPLTIKKKGHLIFKTQMTVQSDLTVTFPEVQMIAGDVDGDGYNIGSLDLSQLLKDYAKTNSEMADLNENNTVDAQDLSLVLKNYGKSVTK